MGDLKHPIVDFGVVRCEPGDEVLVAFSFHNKIHNSSTYIHKSIPLFPEVTICDNANSVSELVLDVERDRDHETNELLFDGDDFILR